MRKGERWREGDNRLVTHAISLKSVWHVQTQLAPLKLLDLIPPAVPRSPRCFQRYGDSSEDSKNGDAALSAKAKAAKERAELRQNVKVRVLTLR